MTNYGPWGWGNPNSGYRGTQAGQQAAAARNARPQWQKERERDYYTDVGHEHFSPESYTGYYDWWNNNSPSSPSYTPTGGGGGGGGGGYGGGGGGGGGGGMTQAVLNSMLQALGVAGKPLTYTPVDLPDFQGQALGPFNAQPYNQALGQINTAATADQRASRAAGQQASRALQANYTNAYAGAPVTGAPTSAPVGAELQATAGGGGGQTEQATAENAAAGSDQASFANLLNVLAKADQTAQSSRMNQVSLDQATAARGINAQAFGLRGGVNTARSQAQNQWQQQAAERAYQNSLMQQQWQREEMMRNQDLANQTNQANWAQRNEMISSRLGPLLELLGQGGRLDTSGLLQLIQSWGA